jgi:hypothetical protein
MEVLPFAVGLLRWFRLLWTLEIGWERATEAEVAVVVGWLRSAKNPQRRRSDPQALPAGSVNPRTGKPAPRTGYVPSTINHALSVVSQFLPIPGSSRMRPDAEPGSLYWSKM